MHTPQGESHTRRVLWAWGAALLYCGLIYYLSSRTGDSQPESMIWRFDKLMHALEYGVLGWLTWRALRLQLGDSRPYVVASLALVLTSLYAVSDEWHQSFVPGRSPSVMDLVADVVGAATCIFMSVWFIQRRRKITP